MSTQEQITKISHNFFVPTITSIPATEFICCVLSFDGFTRGNRAILVIFLFDVRWAHQNRTQRYLITSLPTMYFYPGYWIDLPFIGFWWVYQGYRAMLVISVFVFYQGKSWNLMLVDQLLTLIRICFIAKQNVLKYGKISWS